MLEEKYRVDFLPESWSYNGSYYVSWNVEESFHHPNRELLIQNYLGEVNG